MKQIKIVNNEVYKVVFVALLVLIINLLNIRDITIWQESDVFGYWSSAAYFAGKNWSQITSTFGYFSYGYGLILIPLFYIFDDIILMYKASIVLNALMVSCIFIISYKISKNYLGMKENISIGISLVVTFYPSYLAQSNVAWSEIIIALIVWLVVYLFISYNKGNKTTRIVFISICIGYLYMVHQRTIGILISCILVLTLMVIIKKISRKQYIISIIIITFMLILNAYMKNIIQSNVWLNSESVYCKIKMDKVAK